jgi:hypothetical protein
MCINKDFMESSLLPLIVVVVTAPMSLSAVRQPICDESDIEFGARRLAENSTPLWSHHSTFRNDET